MSDSDLRRLLSDLQSQLEEKTRSEVLAIQRRTELQEDVQKLQTLEQVGLLTLHNALLS